MLENIQDLKKFYIIIRKDINVSVGKIMVHVGHLCTTMAWDSCHGKKDLKEKFQDWYFNFDQTKIILEVRDLEELNRYRDIASLKHGLMTWQVGDAGFTSELKKDDVIMIGIEPLSNMEAIKIGLRHLRTYK